MNVAVSDSTVSQRLDILAMNQFLAAERLDGKAGGEVAGGLAHFQARCWLLQSCAILDSLQTRMAIKCA
jgi:hypothetical protein